MDMEVGQIYGLSGDVILSLGFRLTLLLLIMAILDYAFQRWDYEKNLRMTKQEVKEELKQQEGDPQLRARIRSLQREMSQRRMMSDVGQADVVVTNPTHIAVALSYESESMEAPVVLAKGQRLIAEKIKELAAKRGFPWWKTDRWHEPSSRRRESVSRSRKSYSRRWPKYWPSWSKAHFQLKQSQARVNVSARHRELFNTELGLYGLPEHRQMTVTFDPTQTWFDVEQCRGYPTVGAVMSWSIAVRCA